MGIPILSTFERAGEGNYALLTDMDVRGGLRVVADPTARDAILTNLRVEGMFVAVVSENKLYKLDADLVSWTEFTGGALPPLPGVQFSALVETPIGTAAFTQLTLDMILAAFTPALAVATPGTVLEVGDSAVSPTFTVSYNRAAAAATLADGVNPDEVLMTPFTAGTEPNTYTKTAINASQVFTLSANEPSGPTKVASASISWQPRVYYGAVAPGTFNEAFIEALAASALAPSRPRTFAVSSGAGTKIYYAFPAAYGGGPANFLDDGTGFAAGFTKRMESPVAVTNAFGVVMSYDIWESDQYALGAVTIRVT